MFGLLPSVPPLLKWQRRRKGVKGVKGVKVQRHFLINCTATHTQISTQITLPFMCRERLSLPKSTAAAPTGKICQASPQVRGKRAAATSPVPNALASTTATASTSARLPDPCSSKAGARRASLAAWLADAERTVDDLEASYR